MRLVFVWILTNASRSSGFLLLTIVSGCFWLLDSGFCHDQAEMTSDQLLQHVREHRWHHRPTVETITAAERPDGRVVRVPTFVNEFWTSRQRAAHSLHEISYRACFKPQLPRFFIDRLTGPGAVVYDPFAGRGTTPLEAALAGRVPSACDINPLSAMLLEPRLSPPDIDEVRARLASIDLDRSGTGAARPGGVLPSRDAQRDRGAPALPART